MLGGRSFFYKSLRVGQYGKKFYLYKFRTMRVDGGSPTASIDDNRLTTIGRFLRKYKLDELPTLINLLKGDISIVGSRPDVPSEIDSLNEELRMMILSAKPGLISPATFWNINEDEALRGEKNPHKAYCEKIKPTKYRLNAWYINKKCLCLDMRIILATTLKLIGIEVDPKKWGIVPNWL
jgi:lipopolysaccharide/colanic/teichoic acid biosynthesis glycosyltransferase